MWLNPVSDTRSGANTPGGGAVSACVRRVWSNESSQYAAHLLRLSTEDRRLRFKGRVGDRLVRDHADAALHRPGGLVVGYFRLGILRGAGELGPMSDDEAEVAFSVEHHLQGRGVGSELFRRIILAARNRGLDALYVSTDSANQRMRALARRFGFRLAGVDGHDDGYLALEQATPWSLYGETLGEVVGLWCAPPSLRGPAARGGRTGT